ncbi:MAG: hypothetical protein AAGF89_05000, partial [Bacteroidota bacterium]
YESFEAKMSAYTVLCEQTFEFSRKDLFEIQRMWQECINDPNDENGFLEEETKLMIEDAYEGFMVYLKNEN